MTTTFEIGSRFAGEPSKSIDELFEMLETHPLDPRFEEYGNFAYRPEWDGEALLSASTVRFWGNFLTYSFPFQVDTDDPSLIDVLTVAIRANQQRPDYLAEVVERAAAKAEAEVVEAARRLEQEPTARERAAALLTDADIQGILAQAAR